jgi:hypothetical protein
MLDTELESTVAAGEYCERFQPGGNDFGADAIAGDRGNFIFTHARSQSRWKVKGEA